MPFERDRRTEGRTGGSVDVAGVSVVSSAGVGGRGRQTVTHRRVSPPPSARVSGGGRNAATLPPLRLPRPQRRERLPPLRRSPRNEPRTHTIRRCSIARASAGRLRVHHRRPRGPGRNAAAFGSARCTQRADPHGDSTPHAPPHREPTAAGSRSPRAARAAHGSGACARRSRAGPHPGHVRRRADPRRAASVPAVAATHERVASRSTRGGAEPHEIERLLVAVHDRPIEPAAHPRLRPVGQREPRRDSGR